METIVLTGSRRMSAVHDTTTYVSMEKDEKSQMTEGILNLTLEIIYLLTGEKYAAVKITCIEGLLQGMYPAMSEGWGRSQNSIAVPPPHSPILESKNIQKFQEITNKLMELLTDKVPIRCQDVIEDVSISKDNKYLEGHKDLMIEDQPPLTSPDGSINGNPLERCPRALYSQDSTQEDQEILHHDQAIEQIKVEIKEEDEETYVMDGQPYKEEVHTEIDTEEGNSKRSSDRCPVLPPAWDTDEENSQDSLKVHPAFHEVDKSPKPPNPEEFSPNSSHSPSPNVNQGLHSVAGSPAPSHSEEFFTNRSHIITSHIYPGLDGADRSKDPSNPEGSLLGKSDTASNITPGLLLPYRPSDPAKPEETSSDKSQTSSPNIIPSLLIGYRPPVPSNPEESSFNAMAQRAGTHEDALYPCYSSLVKMVEHQRAHVGDQLGQEPAFGNHQHKHLGKKVFPCVECEKFFAHSADLDKHQRRHSREKPFSCAECGKAYTQKSHLVNHQRLHTGENILPCTECGRCFTLKSQFIKHMRTHTGEKPYCCSECGRCFAQKSTLDNHQTIHTGQKPFSCLQCGKHFARKSTLQKHLELHASGVIAVKPCP
ncbi:uncharacterized protein LOC143956259 [Lithobates pipiens]